VNQLELLKEQGERDVKGSVGIRVLKETLALRKCPEMK
jgi:hypothetical protein